MALDVQKLVPSHTLDWDKLTQIALERRAQYRKAKPFPHIVLDGLFPESLPDRAIADLLMENSPAVGQPLADFAFDGVVVTALARDGERHLSPSPEIRLQTGDALVLFGPPYDLRHAERRLLG